MPLSENEIRNILALDDARLKSVIMQICDAVGADRRKAENSRRIRRGCVQPFRG